MRKRFILGLIVLALAVLAVIAWGIFDSRPFVLEVEPETTFSENKSEVGDDTKVRIIATGDMLPHDTVNQNALEATLYNYVPFFSEVEGQLMSGDIRYCNQESPSAGEQLGISGYPSFNAPLEFPRDLSRVGCNLINLANNHIADRGQEGIDATVDAWSTIGPLAFTGANKTPQEQLVVKTFEVKGKTFSFVAFTDLSNRPLAAYSVNMFSSELVADLVGRASQDSDFVIASAHWGTEDSSEPNSAQRQWAKLMADTGADLVIGTGPHVVQPVEVIKTRDGRDVPVWYSLGNFLSSQLTIEQLTGGIASIELDISGEQIAVTNLSFMPTYMHYEWTPEQAAIEDLLLRKNLKLYPLANAEGPLARSLFNTSVEEQHLRITDILNSEAEVTIVEPDQF